MARTFKKRDVAQVLRQALKDERYGRLNNALMADGEKGCNHNNECQSGRCYNPRQGSSWCERAGRSGDYVMTDADRYYLDRSSDSVIARLVEELEGEARYNCCEDHPHWSCCRRSVDNLKGARVSNQEKGEWCMVHSGCKSNWCGSTSYKCH